MAIDYTGKTAISTTNQQEERIALIQQLSKPVSNQQQKQSEKRDREEISSFNSEPNDAKKKKISNEFEDSKIVEVCFNSYLSFLIPSFFFNKDFKRN